MTKAPVPSGQGARDLWPPPGKWQMFWPETLRPTKMLPVAFYQPSDGRPQSPSGPLLSWGRTSPPHTPQKRLCLPVAPWDLSQVTSMSQASAATAGLALTGGLKTQMEELGTPRSDQEGLGASRACTLAPPHQTAPEASPG